MVDTSIPTTVVTCSDVSKQGKFTCICCRIKLDSAESQRAHFKTEWHIYNTKRRVCSLEPLNLDNFNEIQTASLKLSRQDEKPTTVRDSSLVHIPKSSNVDDDNWTDIGDDDLIDEDYTEGEIDEMLSRVIKSDTCLFCDKKSSSTKSSLDHMYLVHGFFIPEENYMIDLEGMMEYLGFKVGAGATCLWCQKQFSSLKGARQHMIIKDHCKILYDHEKATEEFREFYDYSTQEKIEMKPPSELVIVKKRPDRRNYDANNRMVSKSKQFNGSSSCLTQSRNQPIVPGSYHCRGIKKFNANRAKIALRIFYGNNQTMRGRLRQQNPI